MKRFIFWSVMLMLVSGCTDIHSTPVNESGWIEMSDWKWFSIQAPNSFQEHILRDDGSVALTTYDTSTTQRSSHHYSVYLHPSLSKQCSRHITGASQTKSLPKADGMAAWGRVDYWDNHELEGWEYQEWNDVVCTYAGNPGPKAVYALCSEKDDKTIVICINQMSDNPSLAKQIFETFRWTK